MAFSAGVLSLRHDYVRSVELAGGVPVPLVPSADADETRGRLELLDGLVITGGPAITEGLVGELPGDLADTDPLRATSDRVIARAFLESSRPILGICYGMQLLNALDGGTILADVQRQREGALAHSPKRSGVEHTIEIVSATRLREVLGVSTRHVNSRHIQAVATLGRSYRASAFAPDGVIEAIESEDGRVLGVQFHPERMTTPLFEDLVARAKA